MALSAVAKRSMENRAHSLLASLTVMARSSLVDFYDRRSAATARDKSSTPSAFMITREREGRAVDKVSAS